MTPEELKEIEDRARKASPTFALDFMKREDFEYMNRGRSDVYKLLDYIKELESQLPRWIPVEEGLPEEGIWCLGIRDFRNTTQLNGKVPNGLSMPRPEYKKGGTKISLPTGDHCLNVRRRGNDTGI